MDEVTLTGPTRVAEINGEAVRLYTVEPEDFTLSRCKLMELQGGDAVVNADLVQAVLQGEKGPRRDVVLLNSAFALLAADKVSDIQGGIERAAEAIDSGQALSKLNDLIRMTNQ
jgi:anthranilate phosphoribosyltransferase